MSDSEVDLLSFMDYETMDLALMGFEPVLFPSFANETRKTLFNIFFSMTIVTTLIPDRLLEILHVLSLFLNFLQFMVLTRRSMRNNATNRVLAMISVNQIIISMIEFFSDSAGKEFEEPARSTPFMKDVGINSFRILLVFNFFTRNVFWLPIVMGYSRLKILKENPEGSGCLFGRLPAILVLSISGFFGLGAFLIMTSGGLSPSKEYYEIRVEYIRFHDGISMIIHYILPAILSTVLLFVLLWNYRKAKKRESSSYKKYHETKMIIILLTFFAIAMLPQGISGAMSVFYGENRGLFYIGQALLGILDILNLINSSVYCIIVFKMTPNYKKAFLSIFGIQRRYTENATAAVELQSPIE